MATTIPGTLINEVTLTIKLDNGVSVVADFDLDEHGEYSVRGLGSGYTNGNTDRLMEAVARAATAVYKAGGIKPQ